MSVKARWCHICHQTPPAGGLEALLQVAAVLPDDYEHFVCSFVPLENGMFNACFKLRLREEQELHKWFEDFQTSSEITWRVQKTHPRFQRIQRTRTKYRVDFQCQHSGAKRTFSYKRKDCTAKVFLVLKKQTENISQNRRAKPIDLHIRERLELHITLRNSHNHSVNDSLRYRDVSKETVERMVQLFELGHRPSSALKALKNELREQSGDGFEAAVADRSICPDLFFCYRLFYKLYPHKRTPRLKPRSTGRRRIKPASGSGLVQHSQVSDPLSSGPELQKVSPTQASAPVPVPVLVQEVQKAVQSLVQSQVQNPIQNQVLTPVLVQNPVQKCILNPVKNEILTPLVIQSPSVQTSVLELVKKQGQVQKLVQSQVQKTVQSPILPPVVVQNTVQKFLLNPLKKEILTPLVIQSPVQASVLELVQKNIQSQVQKPVQSQVVYQVQKPVQSQVVHQVQKPVQSQGYPRVYRVVNVGSSRPALSLKHRTETDIRLGRMFNALSEKLRANPVLFEEPLKTMLCTFETMDSDQQLASALNKFGRRQTSNGGNTSRAKRPRIQDNTH